MKLFQVTSVAAACTFCIDSNESTTRGITTNRTVLESLNEGEFSAYIVWKDKWKMYLIKGWFQNLI